MAEEQTPEEKTQPWVVYDTVVSPSFLLGDTRQGYLANGTQGPAITENGEMHFMTSGGRSRSNAPWYTNLELNGQLAYNFEAWQVYVFFAFPPMLSIPSNVSNPWGSPSNEAPVLLEEKSEKKRTPLASVMAASGGFQPGIAPTILLMHAILNFGVLELNLGQENQFQWPLHRFGAGGGMTVNGLGALAQAAQNAMPDGANMMKLPEPVEIPKNQNLDAKIRLAPEVRALIGNMEAPGVGTPLMPYEYTFADPIDPKAPLRTVKLKQAPYGIQLGLVGRRAKNVQYGQTVSR